MENILQKIQSELVAPKGQKNSFGNYSYRNAEGILEALKPILEKHEASVILCDEIDLIGDRYYVVTTCSLYCESVCIASATGCAREPLSRKGMDESQLTGSASSYSSKRALGNLFCISDSSLDPDATNKHGKQSPSEISAPADDDLI